MLECGFNSRKNSKKMKKFLEKIGKKMKIIINCLKKHPRLRIFFFLLLRDQTLCFEGENSLIEIELNENAMEIKF